MTAVAPVLTAGQVAVLRLYAAGNTYREAADLLHISERTAKRRCGDAATLLGTRHIAHTIAEALRQGLLKENLSMSEVVWKYSLPKVMNEVEMPSGAMVLMVAEQHNEICLWARVDPAAGKVTRTFQVVGTGHAELNGTETYLGSAQINNGNFVFHVFEPGVGGEG